MGLPGRGLSALGLVAIVLAGPGVASYPCWHSASRGMPPAAYVLAIAVDARTLYAGTITHGIQKSIDGAATWKPAAGAFPPLGEAITERPAAVISLALDPFRPGGLYAGTSSGGILRTADGGATWTAANRGLHALASRPPVYPPVAALVVDPSRPRTLYASVLGAGVLKSRDGGAHWQPARAGLQSSATSTGLRNRYVRALEPDPRRPGTVYAGTLGGVFETVDRGRRWKPLNDGLRNRLVQALAFEPRSDTLYAGTLGSGVFVFHITASERGC